MFCGLFFGVGVCLVVMLFGGGCHGSGFFGFWNSTAQLFLLGVVSVVVGLFWVLVSRLG